MHHFGFIIVVCVINRPNIKVVVLMLYQVCHCYSYYYLAQRVPARLSIHAWLNVVDLFALKSTSFFLTILIENGSHSPMSHFFILFVTFLYFKPRSKTFVRNFRKGVSQSWCYSKNDGNLKSLWCIIIR